MRPILLALILTTTTFAALAATPAATAHICDGPQKECGNCKASEDHVHGQEGSEAGCVSGDGEILDNGYNAKALPLPGVGMLLAAIAAVALLAGRR